MSNVLHVYPIGGLYNECYSPYFADLSVNEIQTPQDMQRINGIFWGDLFSEERMIVALNALQNHWRFTKAVPRVWVDVLEAPKLFIQKVLNALEEIADFNIEKEQLFNAFETVSKMCFIYSEMLYRPFRLTITDGFIVPATSSRELVKFSLVPSRNPYLPFLEKYCFPFLESNCPDILFVHGSPNISTFAIAYKTKRLNPNAHICLCDHSSEYFSLCKITDMLVKNSYFFSIFDSILLSDINNVDFQHIEKNISENFKKTLDICGNFLYNTGKAICEVKSPKTMIANRTIFRKNLKRRKGSYSVVADGKLFPNLMCQWNQCNFCGINAKYRLEYHEHCSHETIEDKLKVIEEFVEAGVKFFWFYDEALSDSQLREFAQAVVDSNIKFIWHIRSRFDGNFDKDLCKLLFDSGLREVRFGLESVSPIIQKIINKFDKFDINHIEEVICNFSNAGVGIHLPCILGFPTETKVHRQELYDFLNRTCTNQVRCTYNLNILELDIASRFCRTPESFGIKNIRIPCNEEFFLGNFAESWEYADTEFYLDELMQEQDDIMRRLYPYISSESFVPVRVYYRLIENMRLTLRFRLDDLNENIN